MSRIGRKSIELPQEVKVEIIANKILVKGPKGSLELRLKREVKVKKENSQLVVERINDSRSARSLHGLTRTLIANMVKGVTEGFTKTLELHGVGFKAAVEGGNLILKVGFSHPVRVTPPSGISFEVFKNKIKVMGIDKQVVGDLAAKIRKIHPPDSYKGKGIRYEGEVVRKKPGKAAKVVGIGGQ